MRSSCAWSFCGRSDEAWVDRSGLRLASFGLLPRAPAAVSAARALPSCVDCCHAEPWPLPLMAPAAAMVLPLPVLLIVLPSTAALARGLPVLLLSPAVACVASPCLGPSVAHVRLAAGGLGPARRRAGHRTPRCCAPSPATAPVSALSGLIPASLRFDPHNPRVRTERSDATNFGSHAVPGF